jgi:hypothetical protein
LNATKHILGRAGTFPKEKVPMLKALCKKYGIMWGGRVPSPKRADEMHFEIKVKPKKAAKLIKKLGANR